MQTTPTREGTGALPAGFPAAKPLVGEERATCLLPLGYVDRAGELHREAELRSITGREERLLADLPAGAPVAAATSSLLSRCLERVGSHPASIEVVRDLVVGDREFLLLKLFEMTFGGSFFVTLRCPGEGCGEPLEVPLELADLALEAPPLRLRTFLFQPRSLPGCELEFRLPAGKDQEALAASGDLDEEQQQELILSSCLETGNGTNPPAGAISRLSRADRDAIESRMQGLAPRLEMDMEAACPACAASFTAEIDLPSLLLAEMKSREAALEREIHLLAWHYHWPESEILSLSSARRRRYVGMVQEELESMESS